MFVHVAKSDGEQALNPLCSNPSQIISSLILGFYFIQKSFPLNGETTQDDTQSDVLVSPPSPLMVVLLTDLALVIGSGGNIKDPRIGSECSTQDIDYNLRNYLWLLSVNKLYLFDSNVRSLPIFGLFEAEICLIGEVTQSRKFLKIVLQSPQAELPLWRE